MSWYRSGREEWEREIVRLEFENRELSAKLHVLQRREYDIKHGVREETQPLRVTTPWARDLSAGHWKRLSNTDVRCPNDNEMVNFQCWHCGWRRDPAEREATRCGMAEPMWHRYHLNEETR